MDYDLYVLASIFLVGIIMILTLRSFFQRRSVQAKQQAAIDGSRDTETEEISEKLGEEEKELIRNIKEFQDAIAREVMVPRIDVVAVEETTSLKEFRELAVEKGHSRIPVYRETIDHIVGIAYVKDMLCYWDAEEHTITVATFMRPPYFVPETKNIKALLHEFQAKKVHIAVVIDEYGGTAGIVTIEDLLEEVFGEIVDEHDEEEEELITVIDDKTIEVNAKAGIDELEEHVGKLILEHQDFDTVGGLLFSILGDVPKQGETVTYQHLKFTVLNADRHRIVQVKVEQIPETAEIAFSHNR
jgi:CBS domain containing-hemolysin-like protein